jgi:hypothetical protein
MEVLKAVGKIDSDGHLRLDLMTNLSEGKIDLTLIINSTPKDDDEKKIQFF